MWEKNDSEDSFDEEHDSNVDDDELWEFSNSSDSSDSDSSEESTSPNKNSPAVTKSISLSLPSPSGSKRPPVPPKRQMLTSSSGTALNLLAKDEDPSSSSVQPQSVPLSPRGGGGGSARGSSGGSMVTIVTPIQKTTPPVPQKVKMEGRPALPTRVAPSNEGSSSFASQSVTSEAISQTKTKRSTIFDKSQWKNRKSVSVQHLRQITDDMRSSSENFHGGGNSSSPGSRMGKPRRRETERRAKYERATLSGHTSGVYCLLPVVLQSSLVPTTPGARSQSTLLQPPKLQQSQQLAQSMIQNSSLPMTEDALMLSGGDDGSVQAWSIATGTVLWEGMGHNSTVTALAVYQPNQAATSGHNGSAFHYSLLELVFSGSNDDTIRVWSLMKGEALAVLKGHRHAVMGLVVDPIWNRLVSSSYDGTLALWTIPPITARARSATGVVHAVGGGAGNMEFELLTTFEGHEKEVECLLLFRSPCGSSTTSTSTTSTPNTSPSTNTNATGEGLLVSGGEDGTVRLWTLGKTMSGKQKAKNVLKGHTAVVNDLVAAADDLTFFSCSDDLTIRQWDSKTEKCVRVLKGVHTEAVLKLSFAVDRGWLLSSSEDSTIVVWDVAKGVRLRTLVGHQGVVSSFCYKSAKTTTLSPNSSSTSSSPPSSSSPSHTTVNTHSNTKKDFGEDGKAFPLLISAGDDIVRVWDVQSGRCLTALRAHSGDICSIVFLPGSNWVATASEDGTIRFWDFFPDPSGQSAKK